MTMCPFKVDIPPAVEHDAEFGRITVVQDDGEAEPPVDAVAVYAPQTGLLSVQTPDAPVTWATVEDRETGIDLSLNDTDAWGRRCEAWEFAACRP